MDKQKKPAVINESDPEICNGDWKDDGMHGMGELLFDDEGKQVSKKGIWKYGKIKKYLD